MNHIRLASCFVIFIATFALAQSNPQPLLYPSLTPVSTAPGGPGFSLTVGGSGFVNGAVVFWNGSPRTTEFVSSSSLRAAISATDIAKTGTALITVQNPAGAGVSNPVYFQVTNPEATVSVALDSAPTLSVSPTGTAVGDFNGDGKLDLVVAESIINGGSYIAFYEGNGDGTFKAPVLSPSTFTQQSIMVGDYNGDGKPDLVVTGFIDAYVYSAAFLNNGDGTFSQQATFAFGDYGAPGAQGDFTGKGKLDLIGTNCSQGSCSLELLLGSGKGTFPTSHNIYGFDPFNLGVSMVVGDFNGDGKLDFAATGGAPDQIQLFLGNGDGTFRPPSFIPNVSGALAVADVNGDGKLDIVTGACVLLGNGDGTFATNCSSFSYNSPIYLGDFNGDGKLDIAVNGVGTYPSTGEIEILAGNGDGTFQPAVAAGAGTMESVIADFNNDGKLDFGTVGTTGVLQYRQSPASLAPLSLTYASQAVGTTSKPQTVTLSNSGPTTLKIASVATGGINPGDFAAASHCGLGVAGGSSCSISVVFKPTTSGPRYGTLNVTYGGNPKMSQLIELSGTGATVGTSAPAEQP